MDDLVRSCFDQRVSVTGAYDPRQKGICLTDIEPAEDQSELSSSGSDLWPEYAARLTVACYVQSQKSCMLSIVCIWLVELGGKQLVVHSST